MTNARRRRPGRITPRPSPPPEPAPRQWLNDARSALIAGVVAAAIAYVGVVQTINAEDARSATEFLREKQQEAYAELLTDERALRRLADEFILSSSADADRERLVEQKSAIDEAYLEVSQSANNVALIGTPWAGIAALRVDEIHISVRGLMAAVAIIATREPSAFATEKDRIAEQYERLSVELDEVLNDFIENARTDLGSNEPR